MSRDGGHAAAILRLAHCALHIAPCTLRLAHCAQQRRGAREGFAILQRSFEGVSVCDILGVYKWHKALQKDAKKKKLEKQIQTFFSQGRRTGSPSVCSMFTLLDHRREGVPYFRRDNSNSPALEPVIKQQLPNQKRKPHLLPSSSMIFCLPNSESVSYQNPDNNSGI